jgi:hypothetical protein
MTWGTKLICLIFKDLVLKDYLEIRPCWIKVRLSSFPTLITSEFGTKFGNNFLRTAACLTSTLLGNGIGANDCKCSRDQQVSVLPKRGGARGKKFWSPIR